MSLFYIPQREHALNRYVGLSFVLHVILLISFWSILQAEIKIIKTTGVEVEIRAMPGMTRPAVKPGAPTPALPAPRMPAPRRKIGRIVEKKFELNIPKIEPAAARQNRREDDIQLMKGKKIARFVHSEDVEMLEVERKDAYKPPTPSKPSNPELANMPAGEYVPSVPMPPADVSVQYVEIALEQTKIDLDQVKWTTVAPKSPEKNAEPQEPSPPAGAKPTRRPIKQVIPERPENLGVLEQKVQVILRIVIAENGFITNAEIERSSGYLELDNRALSAVRQWIYESSQKKEARLVGVTYVFN